MADKVVVSRNKLVAIADAVREKTGNVETLTLDEMSVQITAIKTSVVEDYDGEYLVIPKTTAQTLDTAQRFLERNIEIKEIPYAETSNLAGGKTAYIGKEIE